MKNSKELSKTKALAVKLIYAAMNILKENGSEMPIIDLMTKVEQKISLK